MNTQKRLKEKVQQCKRHALCRVATLLGTPKAINRQCSFSSKMLHKPLPVGKIKKLILEEIDRLWAVSESHSLLVQCETLIDEMPRGYIKVAPDALPDVMKLVKHDRRDCWNINGIGRDCRITSMEDGKVEFVKIMYGTEWSLSMSTRKPRIYRGRIISEDANEIVYEPITKCK